MSPYKQLSSISPSLDLDKKPRMDNSDSLGHSTLHLHHYKEGRVFEHGSGKRS